MDYIVVKGLAAGQYTRGQVVTAEQLGDRLEKCLRRGIVRPLTEADASPADPEAPQPPGAVVPGSELHEARAQLAAAEKRAARLERELEEASERYAGSRKTLDESFQKCDELDARLTEMERERARLAAR